MLLATGLYEKPGIVLAIDIGTNTEICLASHGALASLSTASGPAFEGAHIKYGMRAAAGAIERFKIVDGQRQYQTIDHAPATGLCGSGILDMLAQLYLSSVVSPRGKLVEDMYSRGDGKDRECVLTNLKENGAEITFTQADIEQMQLAKGAIRTGIDVLLEHHGLVASDLDEIIIAGALNTSGRCSSRCPGRPPAAGRCSDSQWRWRHR
jgi:uncharacterized 2Fe-2S/4Fe-4S cluster protein (DUF4445 family)